ncbi:MAG TPA: TaqI-like C-terminal specificity domain-containing protein, partial [Ktedonobacteraceae bacterium]|nr:TaqI-like C-terminal specificity domain-containing protein [Ktedonobacteraceae bacterium]
LTSKQPIDESPVKYTKIRQLDTVNLATTIESDESPVLRSALTGDYWALDGAGSQSIIEKMKALSVPLGEYVSNKIFYGIKTGFNEAFIIDQRTRNWLIAEDSRNAEIIKPFLVGEDVKRYAIDYKKRYIILTRIGTPIERYPAVFAHLQRYQEQLEKRWDKGHHWWELRSCDYYEQFEKPKIMFPDIARRCQFAYDSDGYFSGNTTYFMSAGDEQKYLTSLLNSSLVDFFFRTISALIRGDYLRFFTQYVTQIPIRRITSTTPDEKRAALVEQGVAHYTSGRREEVLALVESCLASQPEQGDVVHDLLVYLAEQMLVLNKRRQEKVEDFSNDLYSILTTDLAKIARLWTPMNTVKKGDVDKARKLVEAQNELGTLASRQLDLHNDIGLLSESQWRWLLVQRLGHKANLSRSIKVYRDHQPLIVELDTRIATTDRLIDQLVYRLYGLTAEEVATLEARVR